MISEPVTVPGELKTWPFSLEIPRPSAILDLITQLRSWLCPPRLVLRWCHRSRFFVRSDPPLEVPTTGRSDQSIVVFGCERNDRRLNADIDQHEMIEVRRCSAAPRRSTQSSVWQEGCRAAQCTLRPSGTIASHSPSRMLRQCRNVTVARDVQPDAITGAKLHRSAKAAKRQLPSRNAQTEPSTGANSSPRACSTCRRGPRGGSIRDKVISSTARLRSAETRSTPCTGDGGISKISALTQSGM